MSLPETLVEWDGLTLYGTRGPGRRTFRTLEGWEGTPDTHADDENRLQEHGTHDSPEFAGARFVTVSGAAFSPTERDAILVELGRTLVLGGPRSVLKDLRITHAGRVLTAGARLRRFAPVADMWGAGAFSWVAQWKCPDPLRYADPVAQSTGFASPGGGLRFPLFTDGLAPVARLDFGLPGTSGRVTLTNTGSAEARPQLTVLGPVADEGFDVVCVETGERLTYATGVSAGASVVLDSATGRVLLNGDGDRSGYLVRAEWFAIPPGASRTIALIPRGVASAATMTVTIRPPWW